MLELICLNVMHQVYEKRNVSQNFPTTFFFSAVLAALAVQDHETKQRAEFWWDSQGSKNGMTNNVKVSTYHPIPKMINLIKGESVITKPFIFTLTNDGDHLMVHHEKFSDFSLRVNFKGRSSFFLRVPKDWNTQGLGGMQTHEKIKKRFFWSLGRH